jgi:hypothetical protein
MRNFLIYTLDSVGCVVLQCWCLSSTLYHQHQHYKTIQQMRGACQEFFHKNSPNQPPIFILLTTLHVPYLSLYSICTYHVFARRAPIKLPLYIWNTEVWWWRVKIAEVRNRSTAFSQVAIKGAGNWDLCFYIHLVNTTRMQMFTFKITLKYSNSFEME